MNIAYVIHTLGGGGAEKVLVDTVNNLDPEKFNVSVFTLIDTGIYREKLADHVIYKAILPVPKFLLNKKTNNSGTLKKDQSVSFSMKIYTFIWKYFGIVLSYLNSWRFKNEDVIISYLEGPSHLFVSNLRTKAKKVSWIHVDLSVEKKSEIFFRDKKHNRNSYSKFDEIVTVSQEVKDSVIHYIGVDSKPITFLTNIYDDEEIKRKSEFDEMPFAKNENLINFISVGRLSYQKGYDRLILAIGKLVELGHTNFIVRIVGDGEEREHLEKLIEKYKLRDYIVLEGYRDNPYSWIRHSDCFISSSRTEGFSTVVVESLILSTPTIVTNCSGMSSILKDGDYGMIVENNLDGIFEALHHVVSDPFSLKQLKSKAKLAKNAYQKNKLISNLESYLYALMD